MADEPPPPPPRPEHEHPHPHHRRLVLEPAKEAPFAKAASLEAPGEAPAPPRADQPQADQDQPDRVNRSLEPIEAQTGYTDPTDANPSEQGQPTTPRNEPVIDPSAEIAAPDPEPAVDPGENPYHEPSAGVESLQPATPQNEPVTDPGQSDFYPHDAPLEAARRAAGRRGGGPAKPPHPDA